MSRKSKKDRQHNDKNRKDKRTNNDLQNKRQKTKDGATPTPQKTGTELMCSGRVNSSCSTRGSHRVTLVTNPVISQDRETDWIVITTNGTNLWSFVIEILCKG